MVLVWGVFTIVGCAGNQAFPPPSQRATTTLPVPTASLVVTLSPTSTLLVVQGTFEPSSATPTAYPAETVTSERLCTEDDFNSFVLSPDVSNPATLIGFRPPRDWVPAPDLEPIYGSVILGTDYSVSEYKQTDQHLALLEKRICRYGENSRYALSEIVDYILLPNVQADELVVVYPDIILPFSDTISKRLEYQIEIFVEAECNKFPYDAIMRWKYNPMGLPDKIEPGYRLPVQVLNGWFPDTELGEFKAISIDDAFCTVHFYGK